MCMNIVYGLTRSIFDIRYICVILGGVALIGAMKKALGDIIDPVSLQAMEVSAVMAQAGASQEDIEEMMAMILSQGSGVSADFIDSIKEAMQGGGKENMGRSFYRKWKINPSEIMNLGRRGKRGRGCQKYF